MRRRYATGVIGLAVAAVACGTTTFLSDQSDQADAGVGDSAAPDGGFDAQDRCVPDAAANLTDSANCGACGHDCLGGACAAGRCQSVKVASVTDAPVIDMAVDSTRVLWLTSTAAGSGTGSLYACPKTGCATPMVFKTGTTGNLTSDGSSTFVSFINGNAELDQVGATALTQIANDVVTPSTAPEQLSLSNGALYFYVNPGGNNRAIYSWSGGTSSAHGSFSANTATVAQMVVTSGYIFLGSLSDGTVFDCTLPDCSSFTHFTDSANGGATTSMATDGMQVFWVSDGQTTPAGFVYACAQADGCKGRNEIIGPVLLGADLVQSVTFSAGNLYAETSGGDIWTCAGSDCSQARIIAHESALSLENATYGHPLAADATTVYYAAVDKSSTADGGSTWRIMKVAR